MSVRWGLVTFALASTVSLAQAPPESMPQTYTVPAGTKVLLTLKSAINTRTAQQGDGVYMVSNFPVVGASRTMIPVGVYVQGVVDRVVRPGRVKGRAQLDLHFTTMIFPNGSVVEVPGVLNSLPGSDGAKVKGKSGDQLRKDAAADVASKAARSPAAHRAARLKGSATARSPVQPPARSTRSLPAATKS